MRGGRSASLEASDHGFEISLLGRLRGRMLCWRAVDCLVQDWIIRVVFCHGVQIGRTLEEMCALAAGVFGTDGLTVETLCR